MMNKLKIAGLFALSILLAGCATRRQMAETGIQISELRREHQQILEAIARLDSLSAEQNKSSKKLNADLKQSMGAIEDRMSMVESRLDDAGMMVNKAVQTMEARKPQPVAADSADTSRAAGEVDQLKLYNAAYYDVTKGNYDMAVKGFEEYINLYPKTSLTDNAVFWIGECYYIEKDYAKSQKWYEKLIEEYPKSEHLASAKLKLGMSLFNQRYKTKAKQYFEDLVKDYPGTEEAKQAADMLSRY
jgi:tol-pal system protein YbgF